MRNKFTEAFLHKIPPKIHQKMSKEQLLMTLTLHYLFFWSLCEFVGDCFGPQYFSSGATHPQKNSLASHNDLKKDGAKLLLSN